MYGLKESDIAILQEIGKNHPGIKRIIIFGSRARGNYKNASDVDLAIEGDLSPADIWKISGLLNDEAPTPYFFDVVHFDNLSGRGFKERLEGEGSVVYSKT